MASPIVQCEIAPRLPLTTTELSQDLAGGLSSPHGARSWRKSSTVRPSRGRPSTSAASRDGQAGEERSLTSFAPARSFVEAGENASFEIQEIVKIALGAATVGTVVEVERLRC